MSALLQFSDRLTVLPVIHGSGDFAVAVREVLLANKFDCLAVPLPESFAPSVSEAIDFLPAVTAVVQVEPAGEAASYIPIDPCQAVIAAIRTAKAERIPVAWIDIEQSVYEPISTILPDPYALRTLSIEQFAAAILPSLAAPTPDGWQERRVRRMAFELHRLELEHERVVALVHFADWPWVRGAFLDRSPYPDHETYFQPIQTYAVRAQTLAFFLGELPYITALYEHSRSTLAPDENLSIDGVKQIVLAARDRWESKRSGELN